ncbi:zinc finger protein 501-like [Anopheles darlingi]|uniref:zinc finger protein 501-like n=1 Tax=Anopheles darlingi TaxID=43151 RepID=UPI00210065A9|nr:zinc finger protein 501-like [Anopheles darlingi]
MENNLENMVPRFDFLCRFCLADGNCTPIFLPDGTFNERLQKSFEIIVTKVDENDGLPNNICKKCLSCIEDFVDFEATCDTSYKTLEQIAQRVERTKQEQSFEIVAEMDGNGLYAIEYLEEYVHGMEENVSDTCPEKVFQRQETQRDDHVDSGDSNSASTENIIEDDYSDGTNGEQNSHPMSLKQTEAIENSLPAEQSGLFLAALQTKEVDTVKRGNRTIPVVECMFCNKLYRGRNTLKKHLKIHFQLKNYNCTFCSRAFTDRTSLRVHEVRHTRIKAFKCEQCDRSYFSSSELKQHYNMQHRDKNYECKVCSARFSAKAILEDHTKVHLPDRPFVCNICGLCFKRNRNLTRHMGIHSAKTKDRQTQDMLECFWCSRVFETPSKLLDHLRDTHQQEYEERRVGSHRCVNCLKTFSSLDDFLQHRNTHSLIVVQTDGGTLRQCGECGKQFRYRSMAMKHLRTHKSGKPKLQC